MRRRNRRRADGLRRSYRPPQNNSFIPTKLVGYMNGPLRELEPRMSAESVSYAAPPQGAEVRDARRPPLRVLSGRGLRRNVEDRDACSQPDGADDVLAALRQLPATATLRDVVEAV